MRDGEEAGSPWKNRRRKRKRAGEIGKKEETRKRFAHMICKPIHVWTSREKKRREQRETGCGEGKKKNAGGWKVGRESAVVICGFRISGFLEFQDGGLAWGGEGWVFFFPSSPLSSPFSSGIRNRNETSNNKPIKKPCKLRA